MQITKSVATIAGLALCSGLMVAPAYAGDKQQSTIVPAFAPIASTNVFLTKRGKFKIKPSLKPGDGGIITQLTLSGINCPPDNDGGKIGKCGVAGSPRVNHVLALSSEALGTKFDDIVGVKYKVEKGKALFQATGTNKISGAVFGALVSAIYDTPLGVGAVDYHEAGSVPSDCDQVPLPIKTCKGGTNAGAGCTVNANCNSNVCTANGCTDGDKYAQNGIIAGNDPGTACANNTQCSDTQICVSGSCDQEPCATDTQCDQNGTGNGGTLQCGSDGSCCDPNIDPTCATQVP